MLLFAGEHGPGRLRLEGLRMHVKDSWSQLLLEIVFDMLVPAILGSQQLRFPGRADSSLSELEFCTSYGG